MKRKMIGLAAATLALGTSVPSVAASSWKMAPRQIFVDSRLVAQPEGFVLHGTTYLSLYSVLSVLKPLGLQSTWDGSNWRITMPNDVQVDLSHVVPGRGPLTVYVNGAVVQRMDKVAAEPPYSRVKTTFVPLYTVMYMLKKFGISSTWDGKAWNIHVTGVSPVTVKGVTGLAVGQSETLTVTVQGKPVSDSDVTWHVSGTGATVNQDGQFTASTPGVYDVTATVPGIGSQKFTIWVGAVEKVTLKADTTSLVANGVSTANITATVTDAQGNPIPSFSGDAEVVDKPSGSKDAVTVPAVVHFVAGVAKFTVQSTGEIGTDTVTLSDLKAAEGGQVAPGVTFDTLSLQTNAPVPSGGPGNSSGFGTSPVVKQLGKVAKIVAIPNASTDVTASQLLSPGGVPVTFEAEDASGKPVPYAILNLGVVSNNHDAMWSPLYEFHYTFHPTEQVITDANGRVTDSIIGDSGNASRLQPGDSFTVQASPSLDPGVFGQSQTFNVVAGPVSTYEVNWGTALPGESGAVTLTALDSIGNVATTAATAYLSFASVDSDTDATPAMVTVGGKPIGLTPVAVTLTNGHATLSYTMGTDTDGDGSTMTDTLTVQNAATSPTVTSSIPSKPYSAAPAFNIQLTGASTSVSVGDFTSTTGPQFTFHVMDAGGTPAANQKVRISVNSSGSGYGVEDPAYPGAQIYPPAVLTTDSNGNVTATVLNSHPTAGDTLSVQAQVEDGSGNPVTGAATESGPVTIRGGAVASLDVWQLNPGLNEVDLQDNNYHESYNSGTHTIQVSFNSTVPTGTHMPSDYVPAALTINGVPVGSSPTSIPVTGSLLYVNYRPAMGTFTNGEQFTDTLTVSDSGDNIAAQTVSNSGYTPNSPVYHGPVVDKSASTISVTTATENQPVPISVIDLGDTYEVLVTPMSNGAPITDPNVPVLVTDGTHVIQAQWDSQGNDYSADVSAPYVPGNLQVYAMVGDTMLQQTVPMQVVGLPDASQTVVTASGGSESNGTMTISSGGELTVTIQPRDAQGNILYAPYHQVMVKLNGQYYKDPIFDPTTGTFTLALGVSPYYGPSAGTYTVSIEIQDGTDDSVTLANLPISTVVFQ